MTEPVVGFVGLGNIGGAMASRLVAWPGGLVVHDLRDEALAPFVSQGASAAASLDDVASRCDVISVVVLTDAQVRSVVAGLLPSARPGTVIALHSTIETGTAEELAASAAAQGVHVLDAPVSGGAIGAAEGTLAAMVGGSREAYELAKPVFSAWASLVVHLGPAGSGTRAKLARNLLTFAGFAAAAEAARLAEAAGLDLRKLAAVVGHSDGVTGGPAAIMIRSTTAPMAPDDGLRPIFEHTLTLGEKDLGLALDLGDALGVDLPLARHALQSLPSDLGLTPAPTLDLESAP